MAGSPVTAERFRILDELGEDGVVRELLQAGTITQMCKNIFEPPADNPNAARWGHESLRRWVKKGGPAREAWWKEARKTLADVMVDDATAMLDDATIQDVRLRAEQARQRRWVAGILNPDYSGKAQVNVHNNTLQVFGTDLSEALKAVDQHQIVPQPTQSHTISPDSINALPATSEAPGSAEDSECSEDSEKAAPHTSQVSRARGGEKA